MKSHNFILIFCLIFSAFGCKQKPLLTIQDLKFVNVDKNAISRNHIDTTYLISDYFRYNYGMGDTFGYNVYDVKGNLIKEWRYGFMGPPESVYLYDSNNLVIHKDYCTDYWARFDVTYKFVQDSLLLYQYWSDGYPMNLFWFNENGFLIKSLENMHGGQASEINSTFEYDPDNKLIRKVENRNVRDYEVLELQLLSDRSSYGISTHYITHYFYTGSQMDSLITTYYFPNSPENNYSSRTYYDMRGLRTETILKDSIKTIYLHKTRDL